MIIGDTWKDLLLYLKFRRQHLILEKGKVANIRKAESTLNAKIKELTHTIGVVNGNIKEKSKLEYSKVEYLKEQKVEFLKNKNRVMNSKLNNENIEKVAAYLMDKYNKTAHVKIDFERIYGAKRK